MPLVAFIVTASNSFKFTFLLKFQLSSAYAYVIVALAPSTVIPPPSASAAVVAPLANSRLISLILTVVESTYVVLPLTNRLPVTVTFPPTFKFAPIPTPPVTTNAPVVVLSDCVLLVNVTLPFASIVVNAPVALVFAPIAKLSA